MRCQADPDGKSSVNEAVRRSWYVEQHLDETRRALGLSDSRTGRVETFDDLGEAVRGAWMVIEAIPERLELKREVFGQLDKLADDDAMLASNSLSLPRAASSSTR